ncbi:MAG: hypothetical protein RL722_2315 [Pseudomonadota bacterium]|jgi:hypothetical protein
MQHRQMRTWTSRLLLGGGIATVLSAVFAAYLQPEMVVDLANRLWACF